MSEETEPGFTQPSLFDSLKDQISTPHARSTDPGTSQESARLIEQQEGVTGEIRPGTVKHQALRLFARNQALTAHDVEGLTGRRGIWKRVSDLKKAGLIEPTGETVVDPVTNRRVDLLQITERGLEEDGRLQGEGD